MTTRRLPGLRAVLGAAVKADPVAAGSVALTAAVQHGLYPVFPVALAMVTDGVTRRDRGLAWAGVAVLAFIELTSYFGGVVRFPLDMRLRERTAHHLDRRMMALTSRLRGLEHFERPEYADKLSLLREQVGLINEAPGTVIYALGNLVQAVVTISLLARLSPLLLLLLLFGLPAAFITRANAQREQRLQDSLAERGRLDNHLLDLVTSAGAGKELRVFGLRDELLRRRTALWESMEGERQSVALRNQAWSTLGWIVFGVGYVGGLSLVVTRAVSGGLSAGEVVMAVVLASQARELLVEVAHLSMWGVDTVKAAERLGWLLDQADAADAAERAAARRPAPDRLDDGITIASLTFRYPGTDVDVLADVDLRLPAGAAVAVVGDNGAGKSTLVKLLAGMYQPTAGRILVDGVPLAEISGAEWRTRLAAGFQDFCRFELVAGETVGVGDVPRLDDAAALAAALDRASAASVVDGLSAGAATPLGRTFADGVELSGGQWQKLALARAFMRGGPLLLLLDEPTAALDPVAEHALFDGCVRAAQRLGTETGAITLFVSHRFSTVRMADLIAVVDGGRIAECGSHDELMKRAGLYAELFDLQARSYR